MLNSLSNTVLLFASSLLLFIPSSVSGATIQTRQGASDSIAYESFTSSANKNYGVRFVKPNLCDPDVIQYSGYLDMGSDNHYFFWFFEGKNKTDGTQPLTAWLNGGPGCSSMIGLWQENGSCRSFNNGTSVGSNPFAWNQYSNMIFIDQPTGVGYSYGDNLVEKVKDGAVMFYSAIQLFYEAFPQYSKLPFHIFGESFAGRYIPSYAEYIVEQNKLLGKTEADVSAASASHTHQQLIPLESIGIGNGWINPLIQYKYGSTMACESSYGRLLPFETCKKMKTNYKHCAKLVQKCYDTDKTEDCVKADSYCAENIDGLFDTSGRNYYDVRKTSDVIDPPEDYIRLLNLTEFQRTIGVEPRVFEQCADPPYYAMTKMGEGLRDSSPSIVSLLDSGIRFLNYVGDADYLCNWYGNYALTQALKFNGSPQFNNQTLKPWVFRSKEVGQIQSTDQLTFIRVYNAGHEVPYYQPENSLAMFYKWISGKKFLSE